MENLNNNQTRAAVITGASSGMGKLFVTMLEKYYKVDVIYAIARRKERLEELQKEVNVKIIPLALDLSKENSLDEYKNILAKDKPNVVLLVNCAGFGIFDEFIKSDYQVNMNMVDLNCKALQAMSYLTIPYMKEEARIINLASMSSIQPVPYINLYGATKAFVLSFSRALNVELRKQKIRVIAITPYWVKTEFFDVANKKSVINYFDHEYEAKYIVETAYKKSIKKNPKDVCTPGAFARTQYRLVKLLPHKLVMKIWLKKQHIK